MLWCNDIALTFCKAYGLEAVDTDASFTKPRRRVVTFQLFEVVL